MHCSTRLLLMAALANAASETKADIRADANRDGKVDMEGDSDLQCRGMPWTDDCGAIFLANIGDTNSRCSNRINRIIEEGGKLTDEDLDDCNDASDDELRDSRYLAPIMTAPLPELSLDASGWIDVDTGSEHSRGFVRIFHRHYDDWKIVNERTQFNGEGWLRHAWVHDQSCRHQCGLVLMRTSN